MWKIGVLEDEASARETLEAYLRRYGEEHPEFSCSVRVFTRALALLDGYTPDYDLLFLDIRLPDLLGIDAARRIRETDPEVMILFVTNLAQYAIDGYAVQAFDYILKPVNYFSFAKKLERACRVLAHRKSGVTITVRTRESERRVAADDIYYLEISGHDISIHTGTDVLRLWGTLSQFEKQLQTAHFARCSAAFLVNLKYVQEVRRDTLVAGGDRLTISRSCRREFLSALAQYKGGSL